MNQARILIVDDDPALLEALPEALRLRMGGSRSTPANCGRGRSRAFADVDYDAIVSDIKMPGMDGLALLGEIEQTRPGTPTLLITGHGEHDLAVQALRGGAYDFVQKPIDRDYFVASLERAIQVRRLDHEIERQRLALERHALVLEHVDDGVFLVDEDGVVQLWNPAAQAITGLAPEDVLGRPADEALPRLEGDGPHRPRRLGARAAGSRHAKTLPVELDGRELWLSISGVEFTGGVPSTRSAT